MKICLVGTRPARGGSVEAAGDAGDGIARRLPQGRRGGARGRTCRVQPSDEYNIIHVHHFGRAALKMASSHCRARVSSPATMADPHGLGTLAAAALRLSYVVDKAEAYIALSHAEARYYAA